RAPRSECSAAAASRSAARTTSCSPRAAATRRWWRATARPSRSDAASSIRLGQPHRRPPHPYRASVRKRPSPALIVSLLALFVALGGPAQAERLIRGKDVKDGSLQARDLSRGARKALKQTPDGSVGTRQLAP